MSYSSNVWDCPLSLSSLLQQILRLCQILQNQWFRPYQSEICSLLGFVECGSSGRLISPFLLENRVETALNALKDTTANDGKELECMS